MVMTYEFLYQVMEIGDIIAAEDREIADDLLILSCEDDRDFCLPFINQGNLYANLNTVKLR